MSTCTEGLNASLTVEGTQIALLSECTFQLTRDAKEWVAMGSVKTTDVLLGAYKYKVTAKHGYVNNTYLNYLTGGSTLAGSLFPAGTSGGGTISGSLICIDIGVNGMRQENADPVFEDLTFIMYEVTQT